MKNSGKYHLQVEFCNFENRNVENISFSCEGNWAFNLIKDTANKKIGSGHPRASTIKHHDRLKTTVLNENFC